MIKKFKQTPLCCWASPTWTRADLWDRLCVCMRARACVRACTCVCTPRDAGRPRVHFCSDVLLPFSPFSSLRYFFILTCTPDGPLSSLSQMHVKAAQMKMPYTHTHTLGYVTSSIKFINLKMFCQYLPSQMYFKSDWSQRRFSSRDGSLTVYFLYLCQITGWDLALPQQHALARSTLL